MRESLRHDVYHDSVGLNTVGIGHLVQPGDKLTYGQLISDSRLLDFFLYDFNRLKIESPADPSWWGVNHKIAVGSFVWTHGRGKGFTGGQTESLMKNKYTVPADLFSWVKRNWDLGSARSQLRNEADLQLFQKYQDNIVGEFYKSDHPGTGSFYYHPGRNESYYDYDMMAVGSGKQGAQTINAGAVGGLGALLVAAIIAVVVSLKK